MTAYETLTTFCGLSPFCAGILNDLRWGLGWCGGALRPLLFVRWGTWGVRAVVAAAPACVLGGVVVVLRHLADGSPRSEFAYGTGVRFCSAAAKPPKNLDRLSFGRFEVFGGFFRRF